MKIAKDTTSAFTLTLREADRVTKVVVTASDVWRWKMFSVEGTIVLDIDSVGALAGGSVIDNISIGDGSTTDTTGVLKISAADTTSLTVGTYTWQLLLVDESTTDDDPIFVQTGTIDVLPSAGGDYGLT